MAIHIKYDVRGRELLPSEIFRRRINFANYLAEELNIKIKKRELWEEEYIESLDGKLIAKNREIESKIDHIGFPELNIYIHKMEGILKLNSENLVVSLISHNRRNSKIYGDLEIRFYNKDIEDIAFNQEFLNRLIKIIKEYRKKRLGVSIQLIAIGESPDAIIDVRKRYFSYHVGMRQFIEDLLKTLKIESEEIKKPMFDTFFKPYNLSFISSSIEEAPQFPSFIKDLQKEAKLVISKMGSIVCIAEEKNSFEKIYSLFRDDFIHGVGKEWPNRDRIRGIIKNWIGRHKPLDEFSR